MLGSRVASARNGGSNKPAVALTVHGRNFRAFMLPQKGSGGSCLENHCGFVEAQRLGARRRRMLRRRAALAATITQVRVIGSQTDPQVVVRRRSSLPVYEPCQSTT